MGHQIVLSRRAEDDLESIVDFLSRENPGAAIRVAGEIVRHFRVLENFPRIGRIVPEFGEECLREIIHPPYRLIYEVNDLAGRIEVLRVWHGARGAPEWKPG